MCVCGPQPQRGVEKCLVGASRVVPSPWGRGLQRSVAGTWTAHLARSGLPHPAPWAGCDCPQDPRWAPPRGGVPGRAPTDKLKAEALSTSQVFPRSSLNPRLCPVPPQEAEQPPERLPPTHAGMDGDPSWRVGLLRAVGQWGRSYCAEKPLQT